MLTNYLVDGKKHVISSSFMQVNGDLSGIVVVRRAVTTGVFNEEEILNHCLCAKTSWCIYNHDRDGSHVY